MKMTFVEELESKKMLRPNMNCPKCGSRKCIIHHQLKPETEDSWYVVCDECQYEGLPAPDKDIALFRWRQHND